MIKKIKANQLKPGMYIQDFNCSWLDHPFFGSSMHIRSEENIDRIVKFGIEEVYIDTDNGPDVSSNVEVKQKVNEDINRINDIDFDSIKPVSVGEEIIRARKVRGEALKSVEHVMNNTKAGKQIHKEEVEFVVDDIIISLLRNPDALVGINRLRVTDEYLYNHSISVCVLMVTFGKYLGYDSQLLRKVGLGAMLHDIGTMKVLPKILHKKGKLTEEEYEEIKAHVEHGRIILEETEGVSDISIVTAYQHHERLDGTGYPNGVKADQISYTAQAIAIVDVYDALTTKRCFRGKIQPNDALKMIYEWSEAQFNRELVQKFIRCIGIYPAGSLVLLESGLLGIVISHNKENLLQPLVRIIYNSKTDRFVSVPYDLDLMGNGSSDRIISSESPDKWNLYPENYI